MFFRLFIVSCLLAVISASPTASKSKKCYTVSKGYFSAIPLSAKTYVPMRLSKDHHMTFKTADKKLAVEFQSCPKLDGQDPSSQIWEGRIVVPSVGSEQCLTVYKYALDTYFVKVAKCTSKTSPDKSQLWFNGRNTIAWLGALPAYPYTIGYKTVNEVGPILQDKTNYVEIGCNTGCAPFYIAPK